ncbi:hypothetical protein [Bradyrhizobium japonicum]|uniref:hypothetical protein n=1 Tax=Bradyrhizobium japonicum TaxID=375 RepID=UPI001BA70C57|nr:hypothetical protein [Bradyrhizobium japonicum]MBR0961453.1 hypothetical protein [Bradyrhizobium japonicum]
MAGLVPAIHALPQETKNVDARDKPGHDEIADIPPKTVAGMAPGDPLKGCRISRDFEDPTE